MTAPQIAFAHPLAWPQDRPRTPPHRRKPALWRHQVGRVTFDLALGRLREQVNAITANGQNWRVLEQTLSTGYELRADGRPRRDRGVPADPRAAFFFELDRQPHVLACDRWDKVADNIAAVAAHIEALRGQERWGVADLKQAFAGHAALPPPAAEEPWWQVLGVPPSASPTEIDAAWRDKMRAAHPDAGGSDAEVHRLNQAREEGRSR